jgi:hypothetical protein
MRSLLLLLLLCARAATCGWPWPALKATTVSGAAASPAPLPRRNDGAFSFALRGFWGSVTAAALDERGSVVGASNSAGSRELQSTVADWKGLAWGPCTVPCGGGTMTRLVVCWSNMTSQEVDQSQCRLPTLANPLPIRKQVCNVFICPSRYQLEFSCDPGAYYGLDGITDGLQRCGPVSRDGGRLFLSVIAGNRFPPQDPTSFMGISSPYVRVIAGGHSWTTPIVQGALNPVWGDLPITHEQAGVTFFLGLRLSGTPLTIEVWASASGLVQGDVLITTLRTTVIACSFDSDFCDERVWLPLGLRGDCYEKSVMGSLNNRGGVTIRNSTMFNAAVPCLLLRQSIASHNVTSDPLDFSPSLEAWQTGLTLTNGAWGHRVDGI